MWFGPFGLSCFRLDLPFSPGLPCHSEVGRGGRFQAWREAAGSDQARLLGAAEPVPFAKEDAVRWASEQDRAIDRVEADVALKFAPALRSFPVFCLP